MWKDRPWTLTEVTEGSWEVCVGSGHRKLSPTPVQPLPWSPPHKEHSDDLPLVLGLPGHGGGCGGFSLLGRLSPSGTHLPEQPLHSSEAG